MQGLAVVAVPLLAMSLIGIVARSRDLPLAIHRLLLWLALGACVLGLLRAVLQQ